MVKEKTLMEFFQEDIGIDCCDLGFRRGSQNLVDKIRADPDPELFKRIGLLNFIKTNYNQPGFNTNIFFFDSSIPVIELNRRVKEYYMQRNYKPEQVPKNMQTLGFSTDYETHGITIRHIAKTVGVVMVNSFKK